MLTNAEGLFDSDLQDVNSGSFSPPLLHDCWDFLHVLDVPQPDSPVLQRQDSLSSGVTGLLTSIHDFNCVTSSTERGEKHFHM